LIIDHCDPKTERIQNAGGDPANFLPEQKAARFEQPSMFINYVHEARSWD
jgi:hypothetical protein